jgi:hypothetical protein
MTANKIKAYSANVSDYQSAMSGWEKERLAAEAKLRDAKTKKKSKVLSQRSLVKQISINGGTPDTATNQALSRRR